MEAINLNICTDKNVKEAAEKIFDELGINMTTAVNIFLKQTIKTNGIPFECNWNIPNEITLNAIKEGRAIAEDSNVKGYNNMEDLRKALEE